MQQVSEIALPSITLVKSHYLPTAHSIAFGTGSMTQPNFSSKPAPKSRQQVLNARYGHPLPILLPNSTQSNKGKSKSLLSAFSSTTDIVVPQCKGVYDPLTRSVWVTDRDDMDILFRRGFFGKGTLSRSEPSWRERRVDLLKGGSCEFCCPQCN